MEISIPPKNKSDVRQDALWWINRCARARPGGLRARSLTSPKHIASGMQGDAGEKHEKQGD